jgi:moderate conductance mechanosensitive channel
MNKSFNQRSGAFLMFDWYENVKLFLAQDDPLSIFVWSLIKIIIIIVVCRLLLFVFRKISTTINFENNRGAFKRVDPRRAKTIQVLLNNIATYSLNFIMVLLILGQIGVELAPLIAGAGVVGLAIGFGAQNFVKDVISGFFIIFEDQFAVGDVVQIGSNKGTVEEIGMRITKVKSWNGEQYIIPNGSISNIINYSVYPSVAVVDLLVPKSINVDQILARITEVLETEPLSDETLLESPKLAGIQRVNEHGSIVRITATCKPNEQHVIQRKLYEQMQRCVQQVKGIEE